MMKQKIYGHRGASAYAPENTLEAFEKAVNMGADGVELDVHLTKDGELVVTHDEWVERVSDGSGWVKDLTLKELKELHFNKTHPEYKNARIPTLKEVFDFLKPTGLEINIELKNSLVDYPELERKTIEMAAKTFPFERLLFSSFNHYSMLRVKEFDRKLKCGLLYTATPVKSWEYAKRLGVEALHPDYAEVITPGGMCEKAHEAGVQVNTWTVNDAEDIRKVLREGADIVITNYPDIACQEREKNL